MVAIAPLHVPSLEQDEEQEPQPLLEGAFLTCSACQQDFTPTVDEEPGQCVICRRVFDADCAVDCLTYTDAVPQQPSWQDDPGVVLRGRDKAGTTQQKNQKGAWRVVETYTHPVALDLTASVPLVCHGCTGDTVLQAVPVSLRRPASSETEFLYTHLTQLARMWLESRGLYQEPLQVEMRHWLHEKTHNSRGMDRPTATTARQALRRKQQGYSEQNQRTPEGKKEKVRTPLSLDDIPDWELAWEAGWWQEQMAPFGIPDHEVIAHTVTSVLTPAQSPKQKEALTRRIQALGEPLQEWQTLAETREHTLSTEEVDELAAEAYHLFCGTPNEDMPDHTFELEQRFYLIGPDPTNPLHWDWCWVFNHWESYRNFRDSNPPAHIPELVKDPKTKETFTRWVQVPTGPKTARVAWWMVSLAFERLYKATPPPVTIDAHGYAIVNSNYQALPTKEPTPEQALLQKEQAQHVLTLLQDPALRALVFLDLSLGEYTEAVASLVTTANT